MWQKAFGALAIGVLMAAPVVGCTSRPAPRPDPSAVSPAGPGTAAQNTAVARTAAGVGGAGTVESVIVGNIALVALQLNNPNPGGTAGDPVRGTSSDPAYPGTSPGGGPRVLQGPGGSVGSPPAAMPGGGNSPGAAIPGGTPSYTQAVPNAAGSLMTEGGGGGAPAAGAVGHTPMDVMHRVANLVRSKHPNIAEVRFATAPDDARRLAQIAHSIRLGRRPDEFAAELNDLRSRSIPAGTTEFPATHPSQGTTPRR
jgi:hypothetical protein